MSHVEKAGEINFQTILLKDGNVEFKFIDDGKKIFAVTCTPKQVSTLATALLSAVSGSSRLTKDMSSNVALGKITLDAAIPVTNWFFGDTQTQGQKAVVVQIGEAKIGFAIEKEKLRGLGRTLVSASWKATSSATLSNLMVKLLKDFVDDLQAWCSTAVSRLVNFVRRRTALVSSFVRGHSFWSFRTIIIAPGVRVPSYSPVRKCIYCNADVYSTDPHIRKYPLGAEHIVAEGLGGSVELLEASCQKCETATGAVVESDVLGRTMKALRVHLKLKKKGSGRLPKTMPLEATIFGQDKTIQIPIEDYPIVFFMFAFGPPDIDGSGGTPITVGMSQVRLKYDDKELFTKYGIGAFATPYWDNHMICRMLAKIGHALAVAELGVDKFSPLLTLLICNGDQKSMRFIGGDLNVKNERPGTLHRLVLGFQRIKGKTYVVARVRLFASYNSPTYTVVVGESLESRMARFKRIFSSKM